MRQPKNDKFKKKNGYTSKNVTSKSFMFHALSMASRKIFSHYCESDYFVQNGRNLKVLKRKQHQYKLEDLRKTNESDTCKALNLIFYEIIPNFIPNSNFADLLPYFSVK